MKSVSRAAQGRAGRPAVGVPVSSATGGKAGPMRVAACALAITAAIAASPAHAQYYSVDDGGTPGGNSTNNGATGAGSWPPGRMRPRTGLRRRRWDPTRRHREITPSPSASMRWRLARIACRSEEALAFSRMPRDNVAVGTMAGNTMQGEGNAAVGTGAGAIVQGNHNTATGNTSGVSVTGSYNSAFGHSAGIAVYGDSNTAIGTSAGIGVGRIGAPVLNNAAFGALAGNGVLTSTNVAIGYVSGNAVSGGDNNVSIGTYSGTAVAGGNNVASGGAVRDGQQQYRDRHGRGQFHRLVGRAGQRRDCLRQRGPGHAEHRRCAGLSIERDDGRRGRAGAGSVADRAAGAYVDPVSGNGFTTTAGAVSVGAAGGARQVINVAPGVQITDAVNLGQLQSAVSTLNQTINGLPPGAAAGPGPPAIRRPTPRHPQAAGTRRRRAAARWRRATPAPR